MVEDDWTARCNDDIRQYLVNPANTILTVYYRDNVLTTELGVPTLPVYELTYFVKDDSEMLTSKNFHENVTFGTINENVEAAILKIIGGVMASTFFKIDTWPESILYLKIQATQKY